MVRQHLLLNGHEYEQIPGDSEGQENLVCCSPWGHKNSDTTQQLSNNNKLSPVNAGGMRETMFEGSTSS